ncbi:restriction endonuclease [Actinomadura fulvescens]|uniref:HNH endonuclease n=1 Tax=Actinomadura fulvescens TaxID=46160 RepID=A0ABN3Q213_9ACTN
MDWVERVLGIRQYARHGGRAPHKPLLLLHALGRFQREGDAPIPFSAAEDALNRLLREFGPPRKTNPGYPFHHLANDDLLWVVETPDGAGSPGPSLHGDICQETGLDLDGADLPGPAVQALPARDPGFRPQVLEAYDFCCAFCGYDGWLDGTAVGLDAAHLRWHAFGGPDELVNGLCLCALHHRLLDRGVLGVTPERTIAVSRKFVGRAATTTALVHDLSGRPVRDPQTGLPSPEPDHIDWHTNQVFRSPARAPAA